MFVLELVNISPKRLDVMFQKHAFVLYINPYLIDFFNPFFLLKIKNK